MELRDHIISAVKDYSLTLGETQLEQLEKYYELLGDWNKKINLIVHAKSRIIIQKLRKTIA